MSSPLSGIPVEKRRQLAGTLGLFAVLCIAVGAVAATDATTAMIKAFVVIAMLAGFALALLSWGVAVSVTQTLAEMRLAAAVDEAIAGAPAAVRRQLSCDCGHDHDPDELHVVDDPCAHGAGIGCTRSCDTCVLSRLRPSPSATRTQRLTQ